MEILAEASKFEEKYGKDAFIPWNCVNNNIRQRLVMLLNPERTICGNDWTMLASYLGYNLMEINYIKSLNKINTKVLFEKYAENDSASLNKIYNCLWVMGRKDCVEIIDQAYQEINKKAVETAQRNNPVPVASLSVSNHDRSEMGWRNTTVFVTYSKDIDKEVLSLCHFLVKNGFKCNSDVREINGFKYNFEWCLQKISKADFIVVCISPKYLQDTQRTKNRYEHSGDSEKSHLHTKEIYEHLSKVNVCKENSSDGIIDSRCIISLLFGNMQTEDLPAWLKGQGCAYKWKKNYIDLIKKGLRRR